MRLVKPQYKEMTDESLMIAISKGDKRAFNQIYERYLIYISSQLLTFPTLMNCSDTAVSFGNEISLA